MQVEQRRGLTFSSGGGYRLILRDVSEFGWTNSKVTKYRYVSDIVLYIFSKSSSKRFPKTTFIFRTDWANNRIIYSQDFPEKSLNGQYEFKASMLNYNVQTRGVWNMTLYDYA